ncbi:hypothetical protein B0J17DRAFT_157958 [Rhizoctonia solani]|nr:hypothetical protein B0J17DRAFT_157958 [Rhizoctonia solani]
MKRITRQARPTVLALASKEQSEIDLGDTGTLASSDEEADRYVPPHQRKCTVINNNISSYKNGPRQGLGTIPVETLTEIINYLLPLDLLHLARTSKSLRNILMYQSSEPIWFRAAGNLPFYFPTASFDYFNIPSIISMIYTRICTVGMWISN